MGEETEAQGNYMVIQGLHWGFRASVKSDSLLCSLSTDCISAWFGSLESVYPGSLCVCLVEKLPFILTSGRENLGPNTQVSGWPCADTYIL